MQARTFFCHEPDADDFDRTTSFDVIREIVDSNTEFFQGKTKEDHPGFRTARYAGADDAKLSLGDIAAWDELVRTMLVPWIYGMRDRIGAELEELPHQEHDTAVYRRGQAMLEDKARLVERKHAAFMEPYGELVAADAPNAGNGFSAR